MTTPAPHDAASITIIGAGPAGLMAAEYLATKGHRVTVHDRMASVGRKFLMAGRGGLNLTHSEDLHSFTRRYGASASRIAPWLQIFPPAALRHWAHGLGQDTFVGTSGRIFPRAMKASPLLRAWLARLDELKVDIRTQSRWLGWQDGALVFDTPNGPHLERPDAVILALGGASWAKLGSDGAWVDWVEADGTPVAPFRPSNVGFNLQWSDLMREKFAGYPLKAIAVTHGSTTVRGEAIIANYGIEGGSLYALSAPLREAIDQKGQTQIEIDLRPDQSLAELTDKLSRPRAKESLTNFLRKTARLDPVGLALMREAGPLPLDPAALAKAIKSTRLTLTGSQGLERAISSAGGIPFSQINEDLMLTRRPGTFVAGEMIDWEAPTGGYLLQATMASGLVAARGVEDWLARPS